MASRTLLAPSAALGLLLLGATLPARAQAPLRTIISPDVQESSRFGDHLAGLPDLDGDGFGELFVGVSGETDGVQGEGRAYVFSGATGAVLHTFSSAHPEVNGGFGLHVAGVPDVDGDGTADLLVGAFEDVPVGDDVLSSAGRVYLYSGATGAILDTLVSPNAEAGGHFSYPEGVPDVDGDGRGDLLVAAPGEDGGGSVSAGRVYLFSGATRDTLRTILSPQPASLGRFGTAAAGVADVDGDGHGDLLVGAPFEDVQAGSVVRADAGRAHLISGATGALIRTLVSPDPQRIGYFGNSVAVVPDADGDGTGDLLVAALREDRPGFTDAGKVYLFSGATGQLLHAMVSPNPTETGFFGEPVAGVPDVDGDGRGDLLVGAYPEAVTVDGTPQAAAGRAYLFSGATGELLLRLTSPNAARSGVFGGAVAGVPDASGDGRGDLLIGAGGEAVGDSARAGRAYLFAGAVATDSEEVPDAPGLSLSSAPNPARERVVVTFTLDRPGPVRLVLLDALGRERAVLAEGPHGAGTHAVTVDVRRFSSGTYVARLSTRNGRTARLITLVR